MPDCAQCARGAVCSDGILRPLHYHSSPVVPAGMVSWKNHCLSQFTVLQIRLLCFFFFPLCLAIPCVRNSTMIYRTKKKKYLFLCYCPIYFFLPISVEKQDTVIALKQNLSAIRFSLLYKFLQYLTASVAYSVFLKYSVR